MSVAARHGVPQFNLTRDYTSVRLEGYYPWESFEDALRTLDPALKPRTLEATPDVALAFLRRYGRCATREIAAVFGIMDDEAELLLEELEVRRDVARREAGPTMLWESHKTA